MLRWCRGVLLLQGFRPALAARGGSGDACATMCSPAEDGRCVYWPSSASRADLAELFCARCSISEEGCSGALCGDMCRLVDGKCAYHPSMTSKPDLEERYCHSCPYCGQEGSLRYFSTKRLEEDGRMLRELEDLKAHTDKRLGIEMAKLQRNEDAMLAESQALQRSASSEKSAARRDAQMDDSVVGLIAHQSVEEAQLEVADMEKEATQLAEDEGKAEQRLSNTEQVLMDTADDVEQAVHDGKRASENERSAQLAARQGHVLEDAAKVDSLLVESSRVEAAKEEADEKVKKAESLQSKAAEAVRHLASEAQKNEAMHAASQQVAAIEEHIADLAGQEVDAVQTAANLGLQHDSALAQAHKVEEVLTSQKEVASHTERMASKAEEKAEVLKEQAALEGGVALAAAQDLSAVLVEQGIRRLHNKAGAKLEDASQQLAKEEEALDSANTKALVSEMMGQAAAQASHQAKQAALDAAKTFHDVLHHQVPIIPKKVLVEPVQLAVVQNVTQLLPNLLAFQTP